MTEGWSLGHQGVKVTETQGTWRTEMRPEQEGNCSSFSFNKALELSAGAMKEPWHDFKKSFSMLKFMF